MAKGWIKLHRKIFNNPILTRSRTFSDMEAWIWILTNVNHDKAQVLIGADVIQCERGEMITSQKKLCIIFRWGNSKLRNFLKRLHKCKMISFKTNTKLTCITVIKYDTYQSNQTTNKSVLNRKQIDIKLPSNTNKNVKNDKKEKNRWYNQGDKELVSLFNKFWNPYPRKINKKRSISIFKNLSKEDKGKAVEGAIAYKKHIKLNKVSEQYVMHPSTFLNGENWDDYIGKDKVRTITVDLFRYDTTGRSVVGYCSKCNTSDFYDPKSVLFEDSKCCSERIIPERIFKA